MREGVPDESFGFWLWPNPKGRCFCSKLHSAELNCRNRLLYIRTHEDSFFKLIIEHPECYPRYQLLDGLIFVEDGRLCIPDYRDTRTMLLRQHHDNENHFGIAK